MSREEMFAWGNLRPVLEETPDPETLRHGFVRGSMVALKDAELGHRSFRVLCALEGYCWGDDDRESWATNRTLGRRAGGIGPDAVRLALRELEQRGYVRIEPDPSKMRGSRIILLYQLKRPEDRK